MSKADIVNGWYRERLSSGPIARDTEAYNQFTSALPDLIARLEAADSAAAAPDPAKPSKAAKAAPTPPDEGGGASA